MKIDAEGETDIGRKRQTNEDFFLKDDEKGLYAVFDGMGGHEGGEIASQMAAGVIGECFDPDHPMGSLKEGISKAHKIEKYLNAIKRKDMGTTATVMTLNKKNGKGCFIHVGDSRIYRITKNGITQLTRDDTELQEIVEEEGLTREKAIEKYEIELAIIMDEKGLSREQAKKEHPNPDSLLIQAIGSNEIYPQVEEFEVKPGEIYLLCTDGLTGHLKDDEILEILKNPGNTAKALVNEANKRGGKDNITAVVVKCLEGEEDEEDEDTLDRQKFEIPSPEEMAFEEAWYKALGRYRNALIAGAFLGAAILVGAGYFLRDKTYSLLEAPAFMQKAVERKPPEELPSEPAPVVAEKTANETKPYTAIEVPTETQQVSGFKTRAVGPTSSVLSKIQNLKFKNGLAQFEIEIEEGLENVESVWAFFDNNPEPGLVYKSDLDGSRAYFCIKIPKKHGKLNVIATKSLEGGEVWTSSWKYSLAPKTTKAFKNYLHWHGIDNEGEEATKSFENDVRKVVQYKNRFRNLDKALAQANVPWLDSELAGDLLDDWKKMAVQEYSINKKETVREIAKKYGSKKVRNQ